MHTFENNPTIYIHDHMYIHIFLYPSSITYKFHIRSYVSNN